MGLGTTEMELHSFMGAIDVIVPADIRVLCDGDPVVGSFNVKRVGNTPPPADAPTLRIFGSAHFGAVNIKVVDPNAPGWAEKSRPAEDQSEEPSDAAMAAWEEVERPAFACTTIPLWPDVDLDDPAERRSPSTQWALRHNANVSWANQLGMARDEAEFHQIFSSLQSDPAVDTVAARHIAYALTGDPHLQHVSREAAISAMESYFYQQHEQAHQEQRQSQGGAAR